MGENVWQLQDAKNHFNEVVERAAKGSVQTVTKHGKPAVIVMSVVDYKKSLGKRKSWVQLLRECPEDLKEIIPPRPKDVVGPSVFDP